MRSRLLLLGLLLTGWVRAQTPPVPDVDLDAFIQELFDQPEADANYDDLYETLYQFYRTPLDLNRADREELQALYLLTTAQTEALLEYRATFGPLLSLYELQAVPGFDVEVIRRLLPFVRVGTGLRGRDPRSVRERLRDADFHYLLLRYRRNLEQARGYLPPDTNTDGSPATRFAGSPDHLYARYRVARAGDFSAGFTLEKDAGEPFAWRPAERTYLFDYLSAHVQVENRGRLRRLAVGDYQLQVGQGLLLASGFALGKGGEAVATVRRPALGIRPYTSVLETTFFRGAAATVEVAESWELTAFYSGKRVDGSPREDTTDALVPSEATVSAFNVSGL
ncbi:MAG: helix-hairpin-helix domain-containing protein, partial [Catalinimonas sp.]